MYIKISAGENVTCWCSSGRAEPAVTASERLGSYYRVSHGIISNAVVEYSGREAETGVVADASLSSGRFRVS